MSKSKHILCLFKLVLCFHITTITYGQGNTFVKDYNKDGTFDFLVYGMDWLDIGPWDMVLTDGKTGDRWGYISEVAYFGASSFISTGKSRNELSDNWLPMLRAIEDTLLTYRTIPDPSLEWILKTRIEPVNVPESAIFDRIVRFNRKWHNGKPFIPENYSYRLTVEEGRFFENAVPQETIFWHYRSHNHKDNPQNPDQESIIVHGDGLYKTQHGLIEVKDDKYSWLFMSGVPQTGGPAKLRWSSIEKVERQGNIIILKQLVVVGEFAFWAGNPEKGIWIRLSLNDPGEGQDFKIADDRLIISNINGQVLLNMQISEIKDILKYL